MAQMSSPTSPQDASTLPRSVAMAFMAFYISLFLAWAIVMIFQLTKPNWVLSRNWSNIVVPAFLFTCLIVSSYLAGRSLGKECQATRRATLRGILTSALVVSSTFSAATLAMVGVGYVMHSIPLGAVLLIPVIVFFEILILSFFAHWAIAAFMVKRLFRHA